MSNYTRLMNTAGEVPSVGLTSMDNGRPEGNMLRREAPVMSLQSPMPPCSATCTGKGIRKYDANIIGSYGGFKVEYNVRHQLNTPQIIRILKVISYR